MPTTAVLQVTSPERSPAPSSGTFGHSAVPSQASTSSEKPKTPANGHVDLNRSSLRVPRPPKLSTPVQEGDETQWGSNFWVTLVDPQTQTSFFACPATGQVSWDPPVGNFVLPPSVDGEWWELTDESRGLPYYYQTKTGETVWERPEGFVIPLGVIQNTALGRRLSTNFMMSTRNSTASVVVVTPDQQPPSRHSKSYRSENEPPSRSHATQNDQPQVRSGAQVSPVRSNTSATAPKGTSAGKSQPSAIRRSSSSDPFHIGHSGSVRFHGHALGQQLPPIPGSPDITDNSTPPSPVQRKSISPTPVNTPESILKPKENLNGKPSANNGSGSGGKAGGGTNGSLPSPTSDSILRVRAKSSPYIHHQRQHQHQHRSPPPQSLNAVVELLTSSEKQSLSESSHHSVIRRHPENGVVDGRPRTAHGGGGGTHHHQSLPNTPVKENRREPPSPRRPAPAAPTNNSSNNNFWRSVSSPSVGGKEISSPILNHEATLNMSPVKSRANGRPIPVQPSSQTHKTPTATLSSGTYPMLPQDLAMDIQQFSESEYAKQYFSTHRTGFIFRRRVPVAQMMTWQKTPLTSPLLTLNRSLGKDAVKIFKVIQRIMGDRDRDRSVGVRVPGDNHVSTAHNGSTTSLASSIVSVLEEERWLLAEGLTHGELRDEIYCQLMKQLSGNPNPESVFRGMQLFCVLLITFPPSKNFETYLFSYMQQKTTQQEGRVDVMAKYCLRRLTFITKKGPRGKPPSIAEIETASDAAFNPSTFGESLDASIRLQERNYPQQKVPIILPFLADGILALGGTKSEGIFRVPGDGDSVSELKLRIDRGYYTLDGVDDPYVLASLLKLWLRELCDPLVPEELYNECIASSHDPDACVRIVVRLPTINRRVVLFVISFLQLFLDERIQNVTKMTPANLALVMAPNLLRCNSDSMAVVYTNARYEQIFVFNLLLHLKCNQVDPAYLPTHGLGAVPSSPQPRTSRSRSRRLNH